MCVLNDHIGLANQLLRLACAGAWNVRGARPMRNASQDAFRGKEDRRNLDETDVEDF